jgi:hypothetical protein
MTCLPLSPLFCTKTYLPARFRPVFSCSTRLGPLWAGLEQEIEPADLDGLAQFSNRA